MDRFEVKRLPGLLFIIVVFVCLLASLAACAPAAGQLSSASTSTPVETKVNVDRIATQAAATIVAAFSATTATMTSVATPTPTTRPASDNTPVKDVAEATSTPISAVINLFVVGPKTVEALMAQSASAETPISTPTPDAPATATAEEHRLEIALAATLTAQPTATPTTDSAATATAEERRVEIALAATLTAQPTATPTPLPTATWTATPDLAATATADAQRMATAVAGTLTAQPTASATATATGTPTPTATASWTPLPTATPTPDFAPYIANYRQAERAVLQTLSPDVLAQMPIFAHGEALDALNHQVEALRTADQYQILVVENIQIDQVLTGETTGVLATERHNLQTFAHAQGGDRLLENKVSELKVVYGFVFDDGRWKVEKVRIVGENQ